MSVDPFYLFLFFSVSLWFIFFLCLKSQGEGICRIGHYIDGDASAAKGLRPCPISN